jgi:hypothetical protein
MRLATILLISGTLLAGCEVNLNTEGLSAREVMTFKVTGQPEVVLDTFDGSIELHSWDRNEVEVEIERRAMEQTLLDQIKVDAKHDGDKVTITVTGPRRDNRVTFGVHISPTARLRVAVPRSANINAVSGDGSIRAEAIDGRIVLRTSDGSVTASRLGGDVQIRSGDGSIRVDNATGKLDLETEDGSIGVEAQPSVLRLSTGDGSVRVAIDPDTVMTDNWDITTSDGSITLTLPGSFNAELDAVTSDGVVRTNHPLLGGEDDRDDDGDESSRERRERRRTMRTKIGEGGKILKIRSGDGSIRIER